MRVFHGLAATLLAGSALLGSPARGQPAFVPVTKPLQVAGPVRSAKDGAAVYIVKLKDPGAATYKGGAGFGATKPASGERLDRNSGAVEAYAKQLELTHDRILAEVGAQNSKVYSFRYALNGFAAKLTAAQVSLLARNRLVERVWPDRQLHLATNNSSIFLGLEDQQGGLRADLKLRGEGIVVGIIDSGIAPNHPSLSDVEEQVPRLCRGSWATASWLGLWLCGSYRRNPPTVSVYDPPVNFHGTCEAGDGFAPSDCNNKVVGARYYLDGFLFENELDPNEFRSPKDADGHGTHIATIVAGNQVDAYLFGTRVARVSGIAPRARIAVYKACWLKPGETRATCTTSDLTRAIDDAVGDGVDIINYSIGSLETDLTSPDDLALLNAVDAGVLTVVAAGNDGPNLDTIGTPSSAPWVLTVAASTQSGEAYDTAIEITAPSDLAGKIPAREAAFTPQLTTDPLEETLVTADDGQAQIANGGTGSVRDACQPLANGDDVTGHIVLIQRGGCEFQVKLTNAELAGAIAAVVYNNGGSPIVMNGDVGSVDIPAVMIGAADGQQLVDRLAAGDEVTLKLAKGLYLPFQEDGNVMADFSSRGPPLSDQNFLKPDVTAPGVDILAGQTPDVANGLRGETYQYLSGTSQAAPEVSGVAALLKEAHPDWTPGMLKSALMTSAYQGVVRSDGSAADPLDMGAGHIDPNKAVDPGLVYPNDYRDHAAYLCGFVRSPISADECATLSDLGYTSDPRNVNLPSIAVADLITGDTVKRHVTNLGPPATYTVEATAPPNMDVFVDPPTLVLGTGQTAEFSVRFADLGAALDLWSFGQLAWSDGTHTVVSPIALQPVALRAPAELRLEGRSGDATMPVAFGYTGAYTATVHGLRPPFVDDQTGEIPRGFVDDDTSRNFTFRFDNGVTAQGINVAPDQLYLRVALFDEFTDGNDDLDLYLFYCPNDLCTQVGQSGGFTSNEEIDITFPEPGLYLALVHGFQTDQVNGGPGANFSVFTWSFGIDDVVGNLAAEAPDSAAEGDHVDLALHWEGLEPGMRYLGAVSHSTPDGLYSLTLVSVDSP